MNIPKQIRSFTLSCSFAALAFAVSSAPAVHAQEPIRIAFIDPQSGTFAAQGVSGSLQMRFAVEHFVNSKGGVLNGRPFEVVTLDNKNSAQDTQIQLRRAISDGIQIVFSGNSSAVASVLSSSIERHNRRNPEQRIIYFNHSAVDPILTEQECSFWHFRFDAHADMKLDAMTTHIAANPDITRVYIIGQDYSFGQVVSESTVRMLKEKRPDIEIVGNELHPIGQVKDFTPYITKIVSSGANAVITGNWGADMVSLGKGIIDAGLDVPIYTFYAAYDGITSTLVQAGKNKIRLVHNDQANPLTTDARKEYTRQFKVQHPNNDITQPRIANAVMMLAAAIEKAGSADPYDIAVAMEDMRMTTMSGEEIWMRADDHQIFQSLHVSVHTDENVEFDADNSGFGLVTEFTVPVEDTITETSCKMQRPQG